MEILPLGLFMHQLCRNMHIEFVNMQKIIQNKTKLLKFFQVFIPKIRKLDDSNFKQKMFEYTLILNKYAIRNMNCDRYPMTYKEASS